MALLKHNCFLCPCPFRNYNTRTTFSLRPELDACDSPEKYPQLFHVILDVEVEGVDKQKDLTPPWEQFPCKDLSPNVLFSCHQEHQDALAIAGTVGRGIHGINARYLY